MVVVVVVVVVLLLLFLLVLVFLLLLSHINSCKPSGVRGHTKVLEPYEDAKSELNKNLSGKLYAFPPQNARYEEGAEVK